MIVKQKILRLLSVVLALAIVMLIVYRESLWTVFVDSPDTIDQYVSSAPVDLTDGQAGDSKETSLSDVLKMARESHAFLRAEVQDYQGVLLKRERIGGTLGGEVRMQFKIRQQTPSGESDESQSSPEIDVYLKFDSPKLAAGREVIWRPGWNEGRLVVHEGGLKNWTRMNLMPDSTLAMLGNKYPITEIGLAKLLEKLIEKGERDVSLSQAQVAISEGHRVGQQECECIEVKFASPAEGVDFHMARVYIDKVRRIPLRYAAYMWPTSQSAEPPLEEEYTYLDVKLNVGLTDADFDPDNPDYEYP